MPERGYKNNWKNWGHFLGTNYVATFNRKYENYYKVKKFIQTKKIKSAKDYGIKKRKKLLPDNFPFSPERQYKEWKSWGDFLGTGNIANQSRNFYTYYEAQKIVEKSKLRTNKDFHKRKKSGDFNVRMPSNPDGAYKNKGWVSWPKFLGKKN